jgi:hypothetical protein
MVSSVNLVKSLAASIVAEGPNRALHQVSLSNRQKGVVGYHFRQSCSATSCISGNISRILRGPNKGMRIRCAIAQSWLPAWAVKSPSPANGRNFSTPPMTSLWNLVSSHTSSRMSRLQTMACFSPPMSRENIGPDILVSSVDAEFGLKLSNRIYCPYCLMM